MLVIESTFVSARRSRHTLQRVHRGRTGSGPLPAAGVASPVDQQQAEQLQLRLQQHVDLTGDLDRPPDLVAGLDVAYDTGSTRMVGAAVVLDLSTLEIRDQVVVAGEAAFEYIPGLLGFREAPILLSALARLAVTPQVLVCAGYGIAHPRRFGLACHLRVETGLPSFGVAKTPFIAAFQPPSTWRLVRTARWR